MTVARKKSIAKIGDVNYQRVFDWSGGMNDAVAPSLLGDNESELLENISLDEKGTLYPRTGSKERYAVDISNEPVTGIGAYYKSDGTSRLLIGAGSNLYTDKPHLIDTFDVKADWDQGTVAGAASTSAKIDSIINSGTASNVTQTTDTQAEWDAGTKTNVTSTAAGSIELDVRRQSLSITKTTMNDWLGHTLTSTDAKLYPNSVVLAYA